MRSVPFYLCCWPGLARLWLRGDGSALVLSIGFAGFLNLALLMSFVWPQSVAPVIQTLMWLTLLVGWSISVWQTYRDRKQIVANEFTPESDSLLATAQLEYLQGNWIEAETLLDRLLRSNSRDVEARLMKIALLRRQSRIDEAVQQLGSLQKSEGASAWSFEIWQESQWLKELQEETGWDEELIESNDVDSLAQQTDQQTDQETHEKRQRRVA